MTGVRFVILVGLCLIQAVVGYNNGMGRLPPMGWNTWCTDDLCGLIDKCTDSEIRSIADAMVSEGMDKLGYKYIVMDDCWSSKNRSATGELMPEPSQFPNGLKAVADYVHSKGFYFGLYTCVGTETCHGGRPGSYGHWEQDAATVAAWGMDFIKADNCNRPSIGEPVRNFYKNFSKALNATGRPILFNTCEWGEDDVLSWGYEVAQQIRIQADHLPFWDLKNITPGVGFGQGTKNIIDYVASIKPSQWIRQYGWLDPDFLETLFPVTMPFTESRTEYAFWALWSSPLVISTDIRNMNDKMRSIVMNPDVIAVNQDELITAGDRLFNNSDGSEAWSRPLQNGDIAVILFNSADHQSVNVTLPMTSIGWGAADTVKVRDLWKQADAGTVTGSLSMTVAPHDVFMARLTNMNKTRAELAALTAASVAGYGAV